jgi:N-acetylmuramoyl-L-alanine amidase
VVQIVAENFFALPLLVWFIYYDATKIAIKIKRLLDKHNYNKTYITLKPMMSQKAKNVFGILALLIVFHVTSFAQGGKGLKTVIVDAGHGGSDGGASGQYENSLRSKEKDVTLAISLKVVAELKKQMPELNVIPTRTTDIYQNPNEKARLANEYKGDLFLCIHADSGPLTTAKRQIGTRTVTKYKVTYVKKGSKKVKKSTPYEVEEPVYEYYKLPLKVSGTSVYIFAAHKTSDKLKAIMKEVGEFEIETNEGDSSYAPVDFSTPGNKIIADIYAKRYQEKSDLLATLVNDEVEKTGRIALGVNQRQVGIAVLQATNMPAILIETGFINNPEDERYLNSKEGQQELAEAITQAVKRYKAQLESASKASANNNNSQ